MPWQELNVWHLAIAQCAKRAERNHRRMAEEEMRESEERAFQAYRRLLKTVTSFKYLGRVLTAAENN